MYCLKQVVGDVFEEKVKKIFNLLKIDGESSGNVPNLISRDFSFYVEVKASAYDGGGVIKKLQLFRFDQTIYAKRFYAFVYHRLSVKNNMQKLYPSKEELIGALELNSLYLFPLSIVRAFYKHSEKNPCGKHNRSVQLRQNTAEDIFSGEREIWEKIELNSKHYRTAQPFPDLNIMTRKGQFEEQILASIRPEFLD